MGFFKQALARESLQEETVFDSEIDVVAPEEDVEAAILEVENDTVEIENHDLVAEYQDEDAEETEDRLEALDVAEGESEEDISEDRVELITAAQESIRKRHGFTGRLSVARECLSSSKARRVVARESLWEDIKAFFRRMREWFVEKLAMLKDRWIKFHNAGKTIQAKAKKFDAIVNKLGKKDKTELKGGFIAHLTVNSKFEPEKVAASFIDSSEELANKSSKVSDIVAIFASVSKAENAPEKTEDKAKAFLAAAQKEVAEAVETAATEHNGKVFYYANNYALVFKVNETLEFVAIENASVPDTVPTPEISNIRALITSYNKVGVTLENTLKAWRKREQADAAVVKAMKKAEDMIEKAEADNKFGRETVTVLRSAVSQVRSAVSLLDRVYAHDVKHVTTGLNGYIVASLGAYKKA